MDSMKEAFKRQILKQGKGAAPGVALDEAPEAAEKAPMIMEDGDSMIDEVPMEMSKEQELEILIAKIKEALMGAGDHTGRSAMGLNERAKEAALKKQA